MMVSVWCLERDEIKLQLIFEGVCGVFAIIFAVLAAAYYYRLHKAHITDRYLRRKNPDITGGEEDVSDNVGNS